MRKVRVFVDAPLVAGAQVQLPPFAAEHLTRVLRLPDGAALTCFNGDGNDYAATLIAQSRDRVLVRIGTASGNPHESPLRITLVQAIARGERMDLILQKATELGVHRIVPVVSERTEVKLDEDRADRRLRHWQRVVESACEQCGRAYVPQVEPARDLTLVAADASRVATLKLAMHPGGDRLRDAAPAGTEEAMLAVGPEGGFSERDLDALALAGFRRLRLGPRILRTETAGLAALALLQAKLGDLDA